jgi:hypothetical protein
MGTGQRQSVVSANNTERPVIGNIYQIATNKINGEILKEDVPGIKDIRGQTPEIKTKIMKKAVEDGLKEKGVRHYETLEELEKAIPDMIKDAALSKEIQDYLETASKFWDYSFNNQLLILAQNPEARRVASKPKWEKEFGRWLKKGARAIWIWAPMFAKVTVNQYEVEQKGADPLVERTLAGFKPVFVFGDNDTDGPSLTLDCDFRSKSGDDKGLVKDFEKFADDQKIKVKFTDGLGGGIRGLSKGGEIEILTKEKDGTPVSASEQACNMAHELAHEYLHKKVKGWSYISRSLREIEAETTSIIVAKYFGIETKGENYVAVWASCKEKIKTKDAKEIGMTVQDRMDRVLKAAKWIIGGVENMYKEKVA